MLGWLLAAFGAALAAPFAVEALRKPMNAEARKTAPGQFARLSQGVTHYQWTGPEDGPVVVCVHGLTTPGFVWTSIAQGLATRGYRVLSYDLFGRGFSDRTAGIQTPDFFLRQLGDLLADQNVTGPTALIGYSMGGAIVTAFAARRVHPVNAVVLLAPAGMQAVMPESFRRAIRLPLIGRWLMLARYPSMLRQGLRADAALPTSVPDITKRQDAEIGYRGFIPAVHASLVGSLDKTLLRDHETLRDAGTPVLAIWGDEDSVIPLAARDVLEAWNPSAIQHVIDGAGHGLTYTHTDAVLPLIAGFLDRNA